MKQSEEEESVKVGLRMEDALCQSKWSVCINHIVAAGLWRSWPPSHAGDTTRCKTSLSLSQMFYKCKNY